METLAPLSGHIPVVECNYFGEDAAFHHIGLAVNSIREVCPAAEPVVEERQKVSITFASIQGVRVELLEPYGDDSPILTSLRQGNRLLHICYQVPDLDRALEFCRPAGFHRLGRPVPTDIFPGTRVVWVFSRKLGLFELLETPS